jgi:hypothetical protein
MKVKVGDEEILIDHQIEKNNTRAAKKYNNKKIQKKIIWSEFAD